MSAIGYVLFDAYLSIQYFIAQPLYIKHEKKIEIDREIVEFGNIFGIGRRFSCEAPGPPLSPDPGSAPGMIMEIPNLLSYERCYC
jgi:hypothetical protein